MNTNYLSKVLFVNCDKEDSFIITLLLETKNGIVSHVFEKTDFINYYPYLAKKLISGRVLYVDCDCGYLGIEQTEGPYCEKKVFISEYEEENSSFDELLIKLNEGIKNNKKRQRKLIRIGIHYK